jgi:hypothetical protein
MRVIVRVFVLFTWTIMFINTHYYRHHVSTGNRVIKMKWKTCIFLVTALLCAMFLSSGITLSRAGASANGVVSSFGVIQYSSKPTYTVTRSNGNYNTANSLGTIVYSSTDFDSAMYFAVTNCPASRGSIYLPAGTYYTHDLELSDAYNHYGNPTNRDNITVYGDGNSTIIQIIYAESTLASNTVAGEYTLTVTNATGFAVNDRCYVLNDDNGNSIWDSGEAYEDTQIASISNNTLTMYAPLLASYTIAQHAYIAIMNNGITLVNSNNWIIKDLQINGNAQKGYVHNHGHQPNNYWGFGIVFQSVNDSAINLNVLNTVADNIELVNASRCTIESCYISAIAGKSSGPNGGGSGILLYAQAGDTYDNVVKNNTIVGVVGANSTGRLIEINGYSDTFRVFNNSILNNTLDTSLLQAITLWQNCQNNTISRNIFKNINTWVLDMFGNPAGSGYPFAGQAIPSGNIVSYNIFEQNSNAEYEVHLQNYSQYNLFEYNYFQYGHVFVDTLAIGNIFVNNTNFG